MITDFNTIIIGAGVSGLFAATQISVGKVLIIEKNSQAGKKLLITGAGQCNYTHDDELDEILKKYGDNSVFLKPALRNFNNYDVISFFEENGLKSIIREDGKVFPETLQAKDVLNLLLDKCNLNNTHILYDNPVMSINYNAELKFFTVKTNKDKYTSKNIIIATGGKSYPNTGSTGDGYNMAISLGHSISEVSPCLTPINVQDYKFSELSGISFEHVDISIWRNNKKIKYVIGDILFTHKNLSGPGILNNSRYIQKGDTVKINFIGEKSENVTKQIEHEASINGKQLVRSLFKNSTLPKRFIEKLFDILKINLDVTCSQLTRSEKTMLVKALTSYEFIVDSLGGYNIAMCTKGGIKLDEVNRKTMQSKFVDGLYFVGEVLDIDGETGGYNIQAAFSTAKLAAQSINDSN